MEHQSSGGGGHPTSTIAQMLPLYHHNSQRASSLPPSNIPPPFPRRRCSSAGLVVGGYERLGMGVGLGTGCKLEGDILMEDLDNDITGIPPILASVTTQDHPHHHYLSTPTSPNAPEHPYTSQIIPTTSHVDSPQTKPILFISNPDQHVPIHENADTFSNLNNLTILHILNRDNGDPDQSINTSSQEPSNDVGTTSRDIQYDSARSSKPIKSASPPPASINHSQFRTTRCSSVPLDTDMALNVGKHRRSGACEDGSLTSLKRSKSLIGGGIDDGVFEGFTFEAGENQIIPATMMVVDRPPDESNRMEVDGGEIKDMMGLSDVDEQIDILLSNPLPSPSPPSEKKRRHSDNLDRAAKAFKKLKLPFRSPMTRDNLHTYLGLKSQLTSTSKIKHHLPPSANMMDTRPFPKFEESKSPSLRARNIASTRSSKPFRSPLMSSNSSSPTLAQLTYSSPSSLLSTTTTTPNTFNKSAEITALERRLQILKQAKRVLDHPDDRLEELVVQWRLAGRTVVDNVFAMMPEPCSQAPRSFFDEPTTLAPTVEVGNDDDTEVGVWDQGRMMSSLQVDPELLGWDEENADWLDM